jgi:hypothetical protein
LRLDLFACLLTTANQISTSPSTADWTSAWRPVTETVLLQTTAAEDSDNLSHSMSNSLSLCALSMCPFCPRCGKSLHHRCWSLRAYNADPSYCSRRAPGGQRPAAASHVSRCAVGLVKLLYFRLCNLLLVSSNQRDLF